jgi:hypothetical protein
VSTGSIVPDGPSEFSEAALVDLFISRADAAHKDLVRLKNLPQLTRSAMESLLVNLLRNFARRRIPCRRDSRGQGATAEPFHRLGHRAGFNLIFAECFVP